MNIETLIQHRPAVWRQYLLLAVLLAALIIDGLDLQLLSLVAPLLIAEWGVDKAALGPAMSAAMMGMSIGALAGGWLGDRIGRRTVLIAAMLLFGFTTAAVAWADGLVWLTVLRVVGGLGFGAAAPNAITLASEWLGGRLRLRAISWMSIGAPLGGLIGAMILIGYLAELGWRGSFVLCGVLSILTVGLVLLAVPETPSYLLRRGRGARLAAIVRRWFGVELSSGSDASNTDARMSKPVLAEEPASVSMRFVAGCGLGFFGISFVAYGCVAWLPVMTTMNGLPIAAGLRAVVSLLAVSAAVVSGLLMPRLGSRVLIGAAIVGTAVAIVLLLHSLGPLRGVGDASAQSLQLLLAAGLAGGSTGTVLASLYMVLAAGYPATRRSSGIGLGMMLGRAGGIISTFSGGYLMGAEPAQSWPFFGALALGLAGALVGWLLIDRHLVRTLFPGGENAA
jgi:AAHS family 4-hydroxybenzoate transporter-like MFS transporter